MCAFLLAFSTLSLLIYSRLILMHFFMNLTFSNLISPPVFRVLCHTSIKSDLFIMFARGFYVPCSITLHVSLPVVSSDSRFCFFLVSFSSAISAAFHLKLCSFIHTNLFWFFLCSRIFSPSFKSFQEHTDKKKKHIKSWNVLFFILHLG